jgi:hypothetical protein|tara:strand:- start:153 stop:311 length:159 start_codon:yes stop_codon:yes gene_type:complete
MNKSELEKVLIAMGKLLEDEAESLDTFEDDILDSLASSLLCEVEERKSRIVN